jgi:hypothetical protein
MVDDVGAPAAGGRRQGNDDVCLHVFGRCFRTHAEQARVFLRHVEAFILRGRPELVPLLHADGVELLFVTARTPMSMHDVRDHSLDLQHDEPSASDGGTASTRSRRPQG